MKVTRARFVNVLCVVVCFETILVVILLNFLFVFCFRFLQNRLVKAKPITRIVMPVAHDAATGCTKPTRCKSYHSEIKAARVDLVMCLPLIRRIVTTFAICQRRDTLGLLECGVRNLDIRVTYDGPSNRCGFVVCMYVCVCLCDGRTKHILV